MAVFELKNAQALLAPGVQAFFKKVFKPGENMMIPLGFEENPQPVVNAVNQPTQAIFIGVEAGEWKGMAWMGLPDGVANTEPFCAYFFNEGKAATRDALLAAMVDFVLQNGYTSYVALNSSGREDAAWLKTFRKAGEPTKVATVYRFVVG